MLLIVSKAMSLAVWTSFNIVYSFKMRSLKNDYGESIFKVYIPIYSNSEHCQPPPTPHPPPKIMALVKNK